MAKKQTDLLAFQLGQLGLDLVTNPLATPPGTLLTAQNVEFIRRAGLQGLGSRGSLTPLNWEALDGAVMAMAAIPLASPADSVVASLSIDPATLTVSADAASETADVTADNTAWIAVSTVPWLVLTGVVSGTPDTSPTTIDYDVLAFTGTGSRVGKILIIGVGAMASLTVTQTTSDFLEIIPSLMPMGPDAVSFPALVNATGAWTVSADQPWVNLDIAGGGAGVTPLVVSLDAYLGVTFRTATVTVTNGTISDELLISQLADFVPMTFDDLTFLPLTGIETPDGLIYPSANGSDTDLVLLDDTGTPTVVATLSGRAVSIVADADHAYIACINDGYLVNDNGGGDPVPITGRIVRYTFTTQVTSIVGEEWGADAGEIDNGSVDSGAGTGFAPSGLVLSGGRLYVAGNQYPGTPLPGWSGGFFNVQSIDPDTETEWVPETGFGEGTNNVNQGQTFIAIPGGAPGFFTGTQVLAGGGYWDNVSVPPGGPTTDTDHAFIWRYSLPSTAQKISFDPGFSNGGFQWSGPFIHHDGATYCAVAGAASAGGMATLGRVFKLDDADNNDSPPNAWAAEKDVLGTFGGNVYPGLPYALDGDLYWPWFGAPGTTNAGYLLKRVAAGGGIWTKVADQLQINNAAAYRVTV